MMEGLIGTALRVLGLAAFAYAAFALLLFLMQGRMLFLPSGELWATPAAAGLPFEEVWLETADSERLHAWWVPHPEARGTVLFSHGNAGNISHRVDSLELFHALAVNVLIYDYRGYGQSAGRPTEAGLYRDGEAALAWLEQARGVPAAAVVQFGRSMGAAVASRLAARRGAACLVVESAFTSVPDRGAELYWWLPVRWLARIEMDTRRFVAESSAPVLVHSRDDEIVPFAHAQRILDAAGDRGSLMEIRGDHNTGFLASRETWLDGLDGFLERCTDASPD
jgi:fermentation-respiration switch protein FrsA (DUF1100 family)